MSGHHYFPVTSQSDDDTAYHGVHERLQVEIASETAYGNASIPTETPHHSSTAFSSSSTRVQGTENNNDVTLHQVESPATQQEHHLDGNPNPSVSRATSHSTLASSQPHGWLRANAIARVYANSQQNIRHATEPENHNPAGKIQPFYGTPRAYQHKRQKGRLWTLALAEWVATLLLAISYFLVLKLFERSPSIASTQERIFNTLTTGISFLLGVNLTASLKTYAKLMRWQLLALRYHTLEDFGLILSCDGLRNVAKLLIKSHRPRKFPFVSRTQILCFLWLSLNIALALFVACISLTYGLDDLAFFNRQQNGNVSFVDLSALQTGDWGSELEALNADMNAINTWGIRGLNAHTAEGIDHRLAASFQIETNRSGSTRYYLQQFNPNDFNTSAISWRAVNSYANCVQHAVEYEYTDNSGKWSGFGYDDNNPYNKVSFFPGAYPGYGGMAVWSAVNSTCGCRCTSVDIFIARSSPENPNFANGRIKSQYYRCNNTVPRIRDWRNHHEIEPADVYQINNTVARMLAGALGWSSAPMDLYKKGYLWKSIGYTNATAVSREFRSLYGSKIPNATEMADFVSSFTTKAVAAIDNMNTGLGQFAYDEHGRVPIPSRRLAVRWPQAGSLLGGMILGQLVAMVLVLIYAKKAIIKDDSPLSMAKLFFSILRDYGMGEKGCMLRGHDIADEMGNPEVTYGWVDTGKYNKATEQRLGHIDIFVRPQGVPNHQEKSPDVKTKFDRNYTYD